MLLYRCNDSNTSDNQVRPHLKIANRGPRPVALSDLTARYWFTSENQKPLKCWCDHAKMGSRHVVTSFRPLPRPVPGANCYLEIGFADGAPLLTPGSDSGEIQLRFSKEDWSPLEERDDFSFDGTKKDFTPWPRVTLYHQGKLIWGTEPGKR